MKLEELGLGLLENLMDLRDIQLKLNSIWETCKIVTDLLCCAIYAKRLMYLCEEKCKELLVEP